MDKPKHAAAGACALPCTPSCQVMTYCFMQVILLSEGHVLFSGPPGSAVPWFSSLQYEYLPERDGNVSDWLLDLVSVGFTKPEVSAWVTLDAVQWTASRCCDLRPSRMAAAACAKRLGAAACNIPAHTACVWATDPAQLWQDHACMKASRRCLINMQLLKCRDTLCAAGKACTMGLYDGSLHVQGYMGRSMTDIEDVRSAAQLFSNLQSQTPAEQPHLPTQRYQSARRGLLAQLHLLQGPSYPASCALLACACLAPQGSTQSMIMVRPHIVKPGMACVQLTVHGTETVPSLVAALVLSEAAKRRCHGLAMSKASKACEMQHAITLKAALNLFEAHKVLM